MDSPAASDADDASVESSDASTVNTVVALDGGLTLLVAALLGGVGLLHLVAAAQHVGSGSWVDSLGFATFGWAQVALALVCLTRPVSRRLAVTIAAVQGTAFALWVLSRTVGLPVGSHVGVVEPVGLADGVAAGLEAASLVLIGTALIGGRRVRVPRTAAAAVGVAALALATLPLVAADTTAVHDQAAHQSDMSAIDDARCDLGFNPRSYWDTAVRTGVDTYAGGAMSSHGAGSTHAHGEQTATSLLASLQVSDDPTEGRGSAGLDRLISATDRADGGETAAARLVETLSNATNDDYAAWERWMARRAASGDHHAAGASTGASGVAATGDDNDGHGGHSGPQPWVAMTDPAQCVRLSQELATARKVTLAYPTAADAMQGGWKNVTTYVPGIAAHYMKFSIVDGVFDVAQPEMLLYNGEGPEARIVGVSYYLIHPGTSEPSQGFTGPNDHFHRHVGLCSSRTTGIVIGDSTTSPEECARLGGRKSNGSAGWMSHAWVVPGCESPWGVFSGASPLLDTGVPLRAAGKGSPCAGRHQPDRYDLRPGARGVVATPATSPGN
ncbi:MAG: hypothetical protein ACKOYM_03990 [Actinomycetes bacterium]